MSDKQFTAPMLNELRNELNEAVRAIAHKHGLTITFGRAEYEPLEATFDVAIGFAPSNNYDPAEALWHSHCQKIGLERGDYGKVFCFANSKELYKIVGYSNRANSNSVHIRRIRDGKEAVTTPEEIRIALGRVPMKPKASDATTDAANAKKEWDKHCWRLGLKQAHFGKIVQIKGTEYRICGCLPKDPKNSVRIFDIKNNKEYCTTPEIIKKALEQAKG